MLKKMFRVLPIVVAIAVAATARAAGPQAPEDVLDRLVAKSGNAAYLTQSPQNRMMMPDNPAYMVAEDGEKLFKEKRGPLNASLEQCDFGEGPGVLKGAYVELPRYFADTGKVMDLETRLVYCMKTLQGFTDSDAAIKKRHGNDSDMMKLQTYIAMQSNGMPWNTPLVHPLERAMRDAGEVLFYRRAGKMDFACSTCHGATGLRIRASVLPNMSVPEEWTKSISWPAFRVGQDNVRSSQHRLLECLWQMRYPNLKPGSDVSIALISFWTDAARGQPAILPDMKR
ncbi:MAG: sulfur oxidation c-type cytochrome SoxA [Gammaproteobacteria bacterium]|jgi:sulfur-oxidizing protein SoxA|nr:sulfur oxidation c-type cytochrome SoxA [Gammaproteobacteria bacterium]